MKRITNPKTLWDVLGKVYNAVYRLQEIENILGDDYDLEHRKSLWKRKEKDGVWYYHAKTGSKSFLVSRKFFMGLMMLMVKKKSEKLQSELLFSAEQMKTDFIGSLH